MKNKTLKPIIHVLGNGVRGKKQLTLEEVNILMNSKCVLFFPIESDTEKWLYEKLNIRNSFDLSKEYLNGDYDKNNYSRIVDLIIRKCKEFGEVSILIPGHPFVGVTWIKDLIYMRNDGQINLDIRDGISSFDTILTDMEIDPLDHGTMVLDANRLLLFQLRLDPRMNLMIYHICSVGNAHTDFENTVKYNQLSMLQTYLEKYYSANHPVVIIGSKTHSNFSFKRTVPVKELVTLSEVAAVDTSLFVQGKPINQSDIDERFHQMVKQRN